MSAVYDLADRYIDEIAALDPIEATDMGVAGHDDELTDLSPDGHAARAELYTRTLAALAAVADENDRDRVARALVQDRLGVAGERYDRGEHLRDVRVLGSSLGAVRAAFDLMPYDTEAQWAVAARRMRAVPGALDGWRRSLREGVQCGVVAARRQARACAQQAAIWSGGSDERGIRPFFHGVVDRYEQRPEHDDGLLRELRAAADGACDAMRATGAFLDGEYAASASERDAVGVERYRREARAFLGADIDVHDAYEWGWDELDRIETRMAEVGNDLAPGAGYAEVVAQLERDPDLVVEGVDAFVAWNQDLIDRTIDELGRTHFDIAPPLRRCDAMIAPPGGAAAMYYTQPNEDFSRPGRTWYPTLGKTVFPLWREVSTCYHEAVPGHHLQIGRTVALAGELSRFQRLAGFVSGHGEGWALYAERLMGELGYLDDPAYELGMLAAQAMRAVRVIVDIGMHAELTIPTASAFEPGARWTPDLALAFVIERSRFPEAFMRSEVDRYLGLPGQAISYKIGERVWLECRDAARRRHGAGFDLRAFHSYALDLGGVGLDLLRDLLARF